MSHKIRLFAQMGEHLLKCEWERVLKWLIPWLICTRNITHLSKCSHLRAFCLMLRWHDSFMCGVMHSCVIGLIHMWQDWCICDMTHSCVIWLIPWLIHTRDMERLRVFCLMLRWHDSFMCDMTHSCVIRQIHMWQDWCMCDMTHSYVWHDSFTCDMPHSCVEFESILLNAQERWLIHMWHDVFICDMTYSYVTWRIHMWHDVFICDMTYFWMTLLNHVRSLRVFCPGEAILTPTPGYSQTMYLYRTWLIHICDMTHLYMVWGGSD